MSETRHPTDIEVARALNALVVTLNDQRAREPDRERWQSIVTGALGGAERVVVRDDPAPATPSGRLLDRAGTVLATFELRDGNRWVGARVGSPLSGGYVPSKMG
jgi:hypothetical protein